MTGKELKEWRVKYGYTQSELAEELGLKSHMTIYYWECGAVPVPVLVEKYIKLIKQL